MNEINDSYKNYYEYEKDLGRGQFGKVLKAINKKSREIRAIKVIYSNSKNEKYIKNELNNMIICLKDNDNSVKYYEHFHYKDKFAIVMELCDNSLQKILDDKKEGFTCEQILNIMNQLNNTFKIMHINKIIHRDIKLDNILVKYKDKNNDSDINFTVKLTDYGISKQLGNATNTINMGTISTMAPEIFEGTNNANKCDLWSIGIIIYQLFFKTYPYQGIAPFAIYNQIINNGKKVLKKTGDKDLDDLIDKLLYKEPEKRISYEEYFNHPFFKKNKENINYIECEIEIKQENKEYRIINSYEQWHIKNKGTEFKKEYCNEEEIKNNCIIKIDNKIIPFSYFYKFNKKGKYKIIYSFKNNLSKINHIFCDCESLTSINLSHFKSQQAINMSNMFSYCKSLKKINLSNFNTQNVIDMSDMFYYCESITNINLSHFNTQNTTDISHMFSHCISLKDINLSYFNTQKLINMSSLFSYCKSLTKINFSNFNTQNVTDMSYMLSDCESLTKINLSSFNTKNVTNMSSMFSDCKSLINIDLSNFNTENVIDMSYMFFYCKSLTSINLSNFNTKNVINMSSMFSDCESLIKINLSSFNTKKVTNMSYLFSFCISLANINLSNFSTQNVTDISHMFSHCISLTNINLSNFNTKNITNMNFIFSQCKPLKEIKIITNDKQIFKQFNLS